MNPTAQRWAERARRHHITRTHRSPVPIPNPRLERLWRPLERAGAGPFASLLVLLPWNLLRAATGRSWPTRWTGRRHRHTYRAARTVWTVTVVLALAVATLLALAGIVLWPPLWLARTTAGAVLVLAGWTPPTVFNPTNIDPTRALFDDDTEHRRSSTPARSPARPRPPAPPAPPPAQVVSLEERQVAAAEANAAALNRLALVEAARPAQAPVITWHRPAGPSRTKRVLALIVASYLLFGLLLLTSHATGHDPTTTDPTAIEGTDQ